MEHTTRQRGRPELPDEERLKSRTIRLHPLQWAKIDANGGIAWLRNLIDKAKPRPKAQDEE